jgi:Fur family ferric uptake transcriptional regulator
LDHLLDLVQIQRTLPGVPELTTADATAVLRERGVRVTAQRVAVLKVVDDAPHCTADEIETAVRTDLGAVSRQAVYDVLAALTDAGILRRIQPAGSPARYEDRVGDNHHPLICRSCGRTVDVDCAVGAVPCLTAADDAGYEVDEAEVIYWGRCPDCVTTSPAAPGN